MVGGGQGEKKEKVRKRALEVELKWIIWGQTYL